MLLYITFKANKNLVMQQDMQCSWRKPWKCLRHVSELPLRATSKRYTAELRARARLVFCLFLGCTCMETAIVRACGYYG